MVSAAGVVTGSMLLCGAKEQDADAYTCGGMTACTHVIRCVVCVLLPCTTCHLQHSLSVISVLYGA